MAVDLFNDERIINDVFQGVSLTGNSDSLVSDGREGGGVLTAHRTARIYHVLNTQFFSCAGGSGCLRIVLVLASRKSHFISSMFHRTLLDPQLSPHFSTPSPALAPGSSATPSLLYPWASPSTATLHWLVRFEMVHKESSEPANWKSPN